MSEGVRSRGRALLAVAMVAGLLIVTALPLLLPRRIPPGNRLVVLNTGSSSIDSIVVEAEPPGANLLAGRRGYLAAQDSVWLALPKARGDTDIRAYRGEAVVANEAVYFGGNSVFELRVGDRAKLGRYRRLDH